MVLAICYDRICSGRAELAITQNMFFFFFLLDPILSTNGCTGTQFMDAAVRMHELKNQVVSVFYAGRRRHRRTMKHNIQQLFEIKHGFKRPTGSTSPRILTSSSLIKKMLQVSTSCA